MKLFTKIIFFGLTLVFIHNSLFINSSKLLAAPSITTPRLVSNTTVEKYDHFEFSFQTPDTTATNNYFPYDPNPPSGIESGIGITVDAQILPPGDTNWANSITTPCFWYQPVEEQGSGSNIALMPTGEAEWRCRYTPDQAGVWRYRISATDAGGNSMSPVYQFTVTESDKKGFLKVSSTDSRFFEFENGEPFPYPLVNQEQGSPFNNLARIRANIQLLGENGIRFNRWFPTGEGANYFVAPYGDWIRINWAFGSSAIKFDDVEANRPVSFRPYYYASQGVPVQAGDYRAVIRAHVTGERVIRVQMGSANFDICSVENTLHSNCTERNSQWTTYEFSTSLDRDSYQHFGMRGLYVSSDAPSPFDQVRDGSIRINDFRVQKYENGIWGPNILTRSDPNTHLYVDQRSAARLDEIFKLSEQYGVYHKVPLFEKNDRVLNRIQIDGSWGDPYRCSWGNCPNNFYSIERTANRWYQQAYIRYFLGRWSAYTSLHSVELCNECDWYDDEAYSPGFSALDASFNFVTQVRNLSSRPLMGTNSFWGYFVGQFYADPTFQDVINYGDKHWYTSQGVTNAEVNSNTWADSAAYVRECFSRFNEYRANTPYNKPIVRGEGGVAANGTEPQHPDVANETTGTWYHKKVWAHVGILGDSCDGEWYPRLFSNNGLYPNTTYDTFKVYKAYDQFINNEPLNNGNYISIGDDLSGNQNVGLTTSVGNLRAWGVQDTANGNTLLWVDNTNHTWQNIVNNVSVPVASGTVTVNNLPANTYTLEWWNTRTGQISSTESRTVNNEGNLALNIDNLSSDVAIKIIPIITSITPTPTPEPLNQPCTLDGDTANPSNACDGVVNILDYSYLASVFGTNEPTADLNNDGSVNILDYAKLSANFGSNI